MYLVFDTETTGVPRNGIQPRIIQLAFILFDENFQEIERYCELIKPDGWIIPNEKFWIDNGYKTEINQKHGVPMDIALINFINCIERAEFMIAHNKDFDIPIIINEMKIYKVRAEKKPLKICTMKSTTDLVGSTDKRGRIKWPRLEELHQFLFQCNFDGAHDALEDVRATARCFQYLMENNEVWKNNNIPELT